MADAEKTKDIETIDYLGVILSRWWLILLGTLVCAVAAAGVSLFLPNVYEASVVLLIAPPQFRTELKPGVLPAQTYQRILHSKSLMEKVLQNMKSRHGDDFNDTAQIEALKQRIEIVSQQARLAIEQLETSREELESEKERLAMLIERIGAVEVAGKWLGQVPESEIDLSAMNSRQKGITTELLKVARLYQETTERLADLAETADVETLKKSWAPTERCWWRKTPIGRTDLLPLIWFGCCAKKMV